MYKKCIKRLMLLTVLFVFCMGMNVFAAVTEEPVTEVTSEDYTDIQTIHIHKLFKQSATVSYILDADIRLEFDYDDISYSEIISCRVIDSSMIRNGSEYYDYSVNVFEGADGTSNDVKFTINEDGYWFNVHIYVDGCGVVDISYSQGEAGTYEDNH